MGAAQQMGFAGLDVPATPAVSDEERERAAMRAHLASRPLLVEDGAQVERAAAGLSVVVAPPVEAVNGGRSSYTKPRDMRAATRARLRWALQAGPARARTLHRAAVLLRDHGDDARAALWRLRSDGTARTWGVALNHVDELLEAAGVPPAGEQAEAFGRSPAPEPITLDHLNVSDRSWLLAWPDARWTRGRNEPARGHDPRWLDRTADVDRLVALGVMTAEPRGGYRLTETGASLWRAQRAETFGRKDGEGA